VYQFDILKTQEYSIGGTYQMPKETKTLEELLLTLESITPQLDDFADKIMHKYPELLSQDGSKGIGIMLGRFLGIALMDFLCFAFERPNLGYIKTYPQN
jgi:hypothetical protein